MTFSIVARDAETGALGLAIQSHFLAVGSVAGFLAPGVGAICNQGFPIKRYGEIGLRQLGAGQPPVDILEELRRDDGNDGLRQVGMVDTHGVAASFTGDRSLPWSGNLTGDGVSVQGNLLSNERVCAAMLETYEQSDDSLPRRLLNALAAGEKAGGDARGSQSAHLWIVGGTVDDGVMCDLRVDDHPDPVNELGRLLTLHEAFAQVVPIVFDENGPLLGEPEQISSNTVDIALERFVAADAILGENIETMLWRALILAKAGRSKQARHGLAAVLQQRPQLATLLKELGRVASVEPDEVRYLLDGLVD